MKGLRLLLIMATCAVTVASCEGAVDGDLTRDDSPVQTDSLVYTLQRVSGAWRAYATATFRNTTSATVSFARCMPSDTIPMFGIRRTGPDSTRQLFVDWDWACVGGVPTGEIVPGAEKTVRVPLGSIDQPSMQPPLQRDWLIGLMRIELRLCQQPVADSDDCDPLPQAQRQSNAFEVRF